MSITIEHTERGARVIRDGRPSPWATPAEVKALASMDYVEATRVKPKHRCSRNALASWVAGEGEQAFTDEIRPAVVAWAP